MAHDIVGEVLNDTYRIERKLAEGGMGAVYLATHARLPDKRFAVKLLKGKARKDDVYLRFRREAEIATKLGHPNIVEVVDFNEIPGGVPYLVMEYLDGETLSSRLRSHNPLSVDQRVAILEQVASALQAAHEIGVVHRDIKPANIFLLGARDDAVRCKILDFGVSKIRDTTQALTRTDMLVGTFNYMSPEQAVGGSHEVDATSDIFAMGSLTYGLFTGRLPFAADGPAKVLQNVLRQEPDLSPLPPAMRPVVAKALAKKKNERYQRVEIFIAELKAAVAASRQVASLPAVPTLTEKPLPITRRVTASYGGRREDETTAAESPAGRRHSQDPLLPDWDASHPEQPAGRKTVPEGPTALREVARDTLPDDAPLREDARLTRPEAPAGVGRPRAAAAAAGPMALYLAAGHDQQAPSATSRQRARGGRALVWVLVAMLGILWVGVGTYVVRRSSTRERASRSAAPPVAPVHKSPQAPAQHVGTKVALDAQPVDSGSASPAAPRRVATLPPRVPPQRAAKATRRKGKGKGRKRAAPPRKRAAKREELKVPGFDAPEKAPKAKPRGEALGDRIPGLDSAR